MTVSLEDAVFGTAAGVPFVALPPAGIEGRAPMVAVWHPLGPAGSPAEMAAAVPLRGLPAWRVYLGLPRTGERAVAPAPDADFVIDRYTPIVDRAAAEFPAAWAVLRERFRSVTARSLSWAPRLAGTRRSPCLSVPTCRWPPRR